MGGTFDPIHIGHLRMALELYESLNLNKVHFVPCYQPVHRHQPVASAEHRLAMVKCAVSNEPAFEVDEREIRRAGPSYMIDTLLDMRNEMPDASLCLLLGIDAFIHFASWHRWEEILTQAHVIVAHRPNYQLPTSGIIADLLAKHAQQDIHCIHTKPAGNILLRPITALAISASEIRRKISCGQDPKYLLPETVCHYIHDNDIYSDR